MASKKLFLIVFLVYLNKAESASLFERSYEYVMSLGKNIGPSLMSILDCMAEEDAWGCAKLKAGKILDGWNQDLDKQRRSWQDAADSEILQSGRSLEEMPSRIGRDVEESLNSIADLMKHGVARALEGKKHHDGGIDTMTISTSNDKKKDKKKKKKPTKIALVSPAIMEKMHAKGSVQSWVVGREEIDTDALEQSKMAAAPDTSHENKMAASHDTSHESKMARGFLEDAWSIGEKALDSVAEHAIESDNAENGLEHDKSSLDEQRGKKKKKKKAILKLLLLGAVLKAKIGTLLQILSFKLQVKFFIIALLGLAINLARFWLDLKKSHQHQPQKVIYYEHAQHQHHYDDHEESPGWGPWSRSTDPEQESDLDIELDLHNSPYRAQNRNVQIRPVSRS